MTRPEDQAREAIDQRLVQAGWVLQDMKHVNPSAGRGVASNVFGDVARKPAARERSGLRGTAMNEKKAAPDIEAAPNELRLKSKATDNSAAAQRENALDRNANTPCGSG